MSFTTDCWTGALAAGYAVDYANGLLCPWFGNGDLSRETRGPVFLAKLARVGGVLSAQASPIPSQKPFSTI